MGKKKKKTENFFLKGSRDDRSQRERHLIDWKPTLVENFELLINKKYIKNFNQDSV